MSTDLLTSLLALAAAAQFAAGTLLSRRGLDRMDSVSGAVLTVGCATLIYVAVAPFTVPSDAWFSPAVLIFAAVGVVRPSISTILALEGNRRLGPTVSATVASVSPLLAVAGGVLFLAEQLTWPVLAGTLGVVAGVAVLSWQGRVPRSWPMWALALPLGASLIRSWAHVGARWGLLITPSVVLSGLVAYSVSLLVAIAVRRYRGAEATTPLRAPGAGWFVLAGLTNAGAIFSLNTALMLGEVVRVSPLVTTYPLFTLLGSWLFYRREVIGPRTVVGVALIVGSVALITALR